MRDNLNGIVQGRLRLMMGVCLVGMIASSIFLQKKSQHTDALSFLNEGNEACFTRVRQTYTARLVDGTNSSYVKKPFLALTEECYGESLAKADTMTGVQGIETIKDGLNSLSNDVHWFHEKVSSSLSSEASTEESGLTNPTPESVMLSHLAGRFEKLESKFLEISSEINISKQSTLKFYSLVKKVFLGFSFIVPFLIVIEYFLTRSGEQRFHSIEDKSRQLLKNPNTDFTKVRNLVSRALDNAGYNHVKKLFDHKIYDLAVETTQTDLSDIVGRPVPVKGSSRDIERQLDRMIADEQNPSMEVVEATSKNHTKCEATLTQVLDALSSKIFTYGIRMDIQTEEVTVFGESEALQQVFYHILSNAIDSYQFEDEGKYLSIRMRRLGGTLLIDFFDAGAGFSSDFLKHASKGEVERSKDTNKALLIVKELLEDIDASISYENVANEDGIVVGKKVQLSLRAVPKSQLVRVVRGKKSDLRKVL